jgi:hypothetical protein
MDTLEATTTVLNLWPTSFRGEHWRNLLSAELETWDGLERRQVIDRLKVSHNAKRISLETMKQVRSGLGRAAKPSGNVAERERVTDEWLAGEALLEAYQALPYGDQVMIERLVWSLVNRPGWEALLSRQAGPAKYWQPWQRVDHLLHAASKATADGAPLCYPKKRGEYGTPQPWAPPRGDFVLSLPPLPVWVHDDERRAHVDQIFAVAKKYGGLKLGNFGRVFSSKEYQGYLTNFESRYTAAFETQHGPARDDGEIHAPATRPIDLPKNLPPEKNIIAKRKPMSLDGATPEFRKLIGAGHEDTAPNQTTSPPTASDASDFTE